MIDRLIGEVVEKKQDHIVILAAGIGYAVYLPTIQIPSCELGEKRMLYTHLQVREDAMTLYGFLDEKDRALFHLLITVSGIGPKVAIGILSGYSSEEIVGFIQSEDAKSLTKAPGIGKKTAERILLELKDKVEGMAASPAPHVQEAATQSGQDEAYEALLSLGYSSQEAKGALSGIESADVETVIKQALKALSKRR